MDSLQEKLSEFRQNNIKLLRKIDEMTSVIREINRYFDAVEGHELFVVKLKYGEGRDIKGAHDWYQANVGSCPGSLGSDYAIFLFTDKAQAALFKTFWY